jgi:hypothetical protein
MWNTKLQCRGHRGPFTRPAGRPRWAWQRVHGTQARSSRPSVVYTARERETHLQLQLAFRRPAPTCCMHMHDQLRSVTSRPNQRGFAVCIVGIKLNRRSLVQGCNQVVTGYHIRASWTGSRGLLRATSRSPRFKFLKWNLQARYGRILFFWLTTCSASRISYVYVNFIQMENSYYTSVLKYMTRLTFFVCLTIHLF